MAAGTAAKDGSELRLDPDAGGPGLPEWLKDLGHRDGLAAAFDTRINDLPVITGRASRAIARLLKRHGYRLVTAPESFLVSWDTTLLDGEAHPGPPVGHDTRHSEQGGDRDASRARSGCTPPSTGS